jgi:hypothetical protein
MQTVFMGKEITRQDIIDALNEFASEYPDTDMYESWLQKDSYIYAVRYDEKVYPPKHILSQAAGIPTTDFSGGERTNSVFRRLGFEVEKKS